jgi:hypothetical protein
MKVRKTVELPASDLEWFQEAYPHASLSWCLTMLLHNFRSIHQDTGVTPAKVAKDSAKELKASVDEGIFSA